MKKIYLLTLLQFSLFGIGFSQIAINQPTAHESAAFDISGNAQPTFKGLLIPSMSTLNRKELTNAAFGLLVFDTDKSMFYFYDNNGGTYDAKYWRALNPWGLNSNTADQSSAKQSVDLDPNNVSDVLIKSNNVTIQGSGSVVLDTTGVITSTSNINSSKGKIQEYGKDLVPQGVIVMWSGTTIPAGWALCDGQQYTKNDGSFVTTPDLRERFIVGAGGDNSSVTGSAYAIGANGGSNSSAHTHSIDPPNQTISGGDHQHTGTTSGPSGTYDPAVSWTTHNVASDNHTHTFTTNSGEGGHSHTLDISAFTSGGTSNSENRPPYYALAFIMKL